MTAAEIAGHAGAGQLTHARVADKAGVPIAEVRTVFPAKRDLVEAACIVQHHEWFAALQAGIDPGADPRDQILSVFTFLESDAPGCCPCLSIQGGPAGVAQSLAAGHFLEVEHLVASLCAQAGLPTFLQDSLAVLIGGAVVTAVVNESKDPVRAARTAAGMLMAVYEPHDLF